MANCETQDKTTLRVGYALTLLEHSIKGAHACAMIQARFDISRSRAYEILDAAKKKLKTNKDAYTASEDSALDLEALQGQLVYLISTKAAAGDMKAVTQGVKALDVVLSWNGRKATLQASHQDGYCN